MNVESQSRREKFALGPEARVTRLLIMGPQGSGKGTQSKILSQIFGIPTIATGDIFRENIAEGTELGKLAQSYTDHGHLVPDDVTNALVRDRLLHDDAAGGFILDGYPRNLAQVEALDEFLAEQGWELDGVIDIDANRDELVARLAKRAAEEGRVDDTDEVIARRLEIYNQETAPATQEYAKRGLLASVDGLGEIDVITDRIMAALADDVG